MEENQNKNIFEAIKHIDNGIEYWYARELQEVLEYKEWRFFEKVIKNAIINCENSGIEANYHFGVYSKTIKMPKNATKTIQDYKLTRYACYLIVQNANPRYESVAFGKTYFAIKTHQQEISEKEYHLLSEEERRLYKRNKTKKANYSLQQAAKNAGVKNFDKFHNAGYKGLYKGETANDIAKRKGLRYREDILDNMSSEELAANEFRITQAEAKLKRDNIKVANIANSAHYKIGKIVRNAIKQAGGTMPEDLPTPQKSLKQLEKESKLQLKKQNGI